MAANNAIMGDQMRIKQGIQKIHNSQASNPERIRKNLNNLAKDYRKQRDELGEEVKQEVKQWEAQRKKAMKTLFTKSDDEKKKLSM